MDLEPVSSDVFLVAPSGRLGLHLEFESVATARSRLADKRSGFEFTFEFLSRSQLLNDEFRHSCQSIQSVVGIEGQMNSLFGDCPTEVNSRAVSIIPPKASRLKDC